MLAVSYIATDQPELVSRLVREILDEKIDYVSDASIQPSLFEKSVNELKPQKKKWYKNKLVEYAGVLVFLAGTKVLFNILLPDEEISKQLSKPPALPNR